MTSLHTSQGAYGDRRIAPTEIRYIKLGPSGAWVDRCLNEGLLELGHTSVPHPLTAVGDWTAVRSLFVAHGATPSKASDFTRELRDFYTLPETTLWITTARGRLWWAFARPEVEAVDEAGRGGRLRRTFGSWRSTDVNDAPLVLDNLSTRLTKVSAYRQTLCKVGAADYLIRRINAEPEPVVAKALAAQAELASAASDLLQALHWRDFELLVDLIFAGSGWRRVSAVGGSDQADSDLILEQAATGERAMVQVKSFADQTTLNDYAERFRTGGWDRCFFICHTARSNLRPPSDPAFHLWQGETLAQKVVRAGLVDWLIARTR